MRKSNDELRREIREFDARFANCIVIARISLPSFPNRFGRPGSSLKAHADMALGAKMIYLVWTHVINQIRKLLAGVQISVVEE